MRKATFLRLEVLYVLMMWASNFAHPVTPAFFTGLGFPSAMFGISFAAMILLNCWSGYQKKLVAKSVQKTG